MRPVRLAGVLLALAVTTTAVPVAHAHDRSFYSRLGGRPAITAVVEDFVGNVARDNRINGFFAKTDIARLKRLLVQQICAGAGGPCTYEGRSMREAHRGMGVADGDFNALVEDLVKSLNKFNVPRCEQRELLGLLGPMRKDVVQPRPKGRTSQVSSASRQERSLYARLGGRPAITAVVEDFVANVAADKRINGFFGDTDIPRLKRLLVQQICAGSGGPCTYEGRSMRETHRGLNVRNQDFDALVQDLAKSLDKLNVPEREKGELLGLLGPMRKDVVQATSLVHGQAEGMTHN
ncbi:MAG TPA: group 1 truncated hemoglobin [Hyphomicrobiaceae bacterium]|nr:group 1 truncated hemoglobin [Hyphomicrobiaceae bacterium]